MGFESSSSQCFSCSNTLSDYTCASMCPFSDIGSPCFQAQPNNFHVIVLPIESLSKIWLSDANVFCFSTLVLSVLSSVKPGAWLADPQNSLPGLPAPGPSSVLFSQRHLSCADLCRTLNSYMGPGIRVCPVNKNYCEVEGGDQQCNLEQASHPPPQISLCLGFFISEIGVIWLVLWEDSVE